MGVVDNFIHLFAPLTANCRDFHGQWTTALDAPAHSVAGRWEGEWISAATGHRGRLRGVIDARDPARWTVWFRAEYSGIFRACYSTEFAARPEGDRWTFSGGSNLGALAGGEYTYAGSATETSLICTYRSNRDHGEFRLRKVTPA
jgi:hypothetical protein